MPLPDIDAADPSFVDPQKRDTAEDPVVRKMRAPVPSEHIVGFPEMHESLVSIVIPDIAVLLICLSDISERGMKLHVQCVFSLPQTVCDVVFPDTVHIAGVSQELPVQVYGCAGVQPVKRKQPRPAPHQRLIRHKPALILVVVLHKGARRILIVLPVRIFHISISEKICIYSSRNHGALPRSAGHTAHSPTAV